MAANRSIPKKPEKQGVRQIAKNPTPSYPAPKKIDGARDISNGSMGNGPYTPCKWKDPVKYKKG